MTTGIENNAVQISALSQVLEVSPKKETNSV